MCTGIMHPFKNLIPVVLIYGNRFTGTFIVSTGGQSSMHGQSHTVYGILHVNFHNIDSVYIYMYKCACACYLVRVGILYMCIV